MRRGDAVHVGLHRDIAAEGKCLFEGTRRVGELLGSHEGCQVPFRPSGRNRGLPLRRRGGQGPHLAKRWYVILDTDKTEDLFGFIVAHGNDPVVYNESAFIDSLYDSDEASYSPFWVNENGAVVWDTYVFSTNDPGFFDLVICYEDKPTAMIVLRIYPDESLNDFTDEQLESFMKEATEEAKQVNL